MGSSTAQGSTPFFPDELEKKIVQFVLFFNLINRFNKNGLEALKAI